MKILIVAGRSRMPALLMNLETEKVVREVKSLVKNRRHAEAIISAVKKGRFEKKVEPCDIPALHADLILSETNAYWDITK